MSALLTLGFMLPLAGSAPPITQAQKIAIIRTLVAEAGIARTPFPADSHGIEINPQGTILNPGDVGANLASSGAAARTGGRVVITDIEFKGDQVICAINGGPVKKHWWDHFSGGLAGSIQAINTRAQEPHGAQITIKFKGKVPGLTPAEVKRALAGVIDWSPPEVAEQMVKPLPAPVKAAITDHRVLVGMTPGMVVAAMGRTGNKIRQTDPKTGYTYEDWIYGDPPKNTVFVRIENDRVIRVATYFPGGGEKIDTRVDPSLAEAADTTGAPPGAPSLSGLGGDSSSSAQSQRPSLRRPGDAPSPDQMPRRTNSPPPPDTMGLPQGAPTMPDASSTAGPPTMPTGAPGSGSGMPGGTPDGGTGMPPGGY